MDYHLKTAERLARLLDEEFRILGFRVGLDPIIGLLPGFGDVAPLLLSLYIVWIGSQVGVPPAKINQMLLNSLFDFLVGLVPFVGDLADFGFKANTRNLSILRQHAVHQSHR